MKRLLLCLLLATPARPQPAGTVYARFCTQPEVTEVYQQVSSSERPGRFLGTSDRRIALDARGSQVWLVFRAAGYRDLVVAVAPAYFQHGHSWPERGALRLTPLSLWIGFPTTWFWAGIAVLGTGWFWHRRPSPRRHFAGYQLLELVGQGGAGRVYRAQPMGQSSRFVALKIYQAESCAMPQPEGHPGFVQVYHSGEWDGVVYQGLEWLGGGTLRLRMNSGLPGRAQVRDWLEKICDALFYAHREGFVHADVKPENILFSESGCLKLADFSGQQECAGTPAYRSPEQTLGKAVSPQTDQYAVALLAYEMLTGGLPDGFTRALQPLPPVCASRPELDPRLDDVLRRMSEPVPEHRYPDLGQAGRHLLECL